MAKMTKVELLKQLDVHRIRHREVEIELFRTQNELHKTKRELSAIKEGFIRAIEGSINPNTWTFSIEPRIANATNDLEKEKRYE